MTTEIYLDGNATTAVLPAAASAALGTMHTLYGNPSSSHASGLKAKAMMEDVRTRARRLLGITDGRLMFNSGATEGIQTAILSALLALRERRASGQPIGTWLVVGATEHKAVSESLSHWNRVLDLNLDIAPLAVDCRGQHDLAQLRQLAPDAALVCTMAANNETGVISDLAAIEAVLAQTGSAAYWLVDCVQALGKLALDLGSSRIDYAPFSGHKLYAPKGIGMLYVRAGAPFTALMVGGGQESAQRSGTENMAGIAALGEVLAALEAGNVFRTRQELEDLRGRLVASLLAAFPGIVFNAPLDLALPTTINFSVPWASSKELLDLFDAAAVRVSAGSACSAASAQASYVLKAMGLQGWQSEAAVRLSFGPLATAADIDAACTRIVHCGEVLRAAGMTPQQDAHADTLAPADGPIRFAHGGRNTWLIVDSASRGCAVIDPQDALAARVGRYIEAHGYDVRAVLHTEASGTADTSIGRRGRIGSMVLTGIAHDASDSHGIVYLLNRPGQAAHIAFIGQLAPASLAPGLVGSDTLLLASHGDTGRMCTTLRAEDGAPASGGTAELAPGDVARFLRNRPDALLVDVRERIEQLASRLDRAPGAQSVSAPLSELTGRIDAWLASPRVPLVFFCRSGNRSALAAACLRRLGHEAAWTVTGGMAAAGDALQDEVWT